MSTTLISDLVHQSLSMTSFARECYIEGGNAALYKGWALPIGSITEALVEELVALPEEPFLAAREASELDATSAVVVGARIASGLGLSEIPADALARAEQRAKEMLAQSPALARLVGETPPQVVVAAQGGRARATLAHGVRSGYASTPGLTHTMAHDSCDQWENDEQDDGVLGIRIGSAGPYRSPMSRVLPSHQLGQASQQSGGSLFLVFTHGN